jgi:hypothetical protein
MGQEGNTMSANLSKLRNLAKRLLGRDGGNQAEIRNRRNAVTARQTDYRRWTDAKHYNPQWATRSHLALELLGDARWICDIGCGPQDLKALLPEGSIYLPMDLKQWTEDTITCDINGKKLPRDYIELSDCCFVMGVLEYIFDWDWFLKALAGSAESVIISYNVAELCRVAREDNGWVNNLSSEQFKQAITSAGFKIEDTRLYDNAQLIVKAANPSFDAAARSERETKRQRLLLQREAQGSGPL